LRSWQIFKIWGIPFKVHPYWFVILFLFSWSISNQVNLSSGDIYNNKEAWIIGFLTSFFLLFSIIFYILVVLMGEVLPKALGTRFSVQIALLSVPILRIINILMRPFLILIEQIFPVITAENEISTDEEEIRQMAKIGSQKGLIEADEAAMIFKVFQLNDLKAKDLMTPRVSAPCLDGSSNLDKISKLIMSDSSPWWVILGDKVDKIQGVVKREKMLAELINGENKKLLSEICEPVEYIPEMIRADQLLTRFDKNHKGVKVVVDEFGGFVGIIGAEAVLSVLAGWWKNKS